jgi:hypothetical protein
MTKTTLWAIGIIAVLVVVFIGGRFTERMKNGYFYEVRDEHEVPYSIGLVSVKYVTESVGLPFLDPGTSVVSINDAKCGPITLYKAKRTFQESYPFVEAVLVRDNELTWNDGIYSYQLQIVPLTGAASNSRESTGNGPVGSRERIEFVSPEGATRD